MRCTGIGEGSHSQPPGDTCLGCARPPAWPAPAPVRCCEACECVHRRTPQQHTPRGKHSTVQKRRIPLSLARLVKSVSLSPRGRAPPTQTLHHHHPPTHPLATGGVGGGRRAGGHGEEPAYQDRQPRPAPRPGGVFPFPAFLSLLPVSLSLSLCLCFCAANSASVWLDRRRRRGRSPISRRGATSRFGAESAFLDCTRVVQLLLERCTDG